MVLSILAGRVRREILFSLARGEKDVATLAGALRVRVPLVSSNLRPLREHGLVEVEQRARRRVYRLGRAASAVVRGGEIRLTIVTRDKSTVCITRVLRNGSR